MDVDPSETRCINMRQEFNEYLESEGLADVSKNLTDIHLILHLKPHQIEFRQKRLKVSKMNKELIGKILTKARQMKKLKIKLVSVIFLKLYDELFIVLKAGMDDMPILTKNTGSYMARTLKSMVSSLQISIFTCKL